MAKRLDSPPNSKEITDCAAIQDKQPLHLQELKSLHRKLGDDPLPEQKILIRVIHRNQKNLWILL
jgi:uncharacterized protein YqfB (UPF0267 family)